MGEISTKQIGYLYKQTGLDLSLICPAAISAQLHDDLMLADI